MFKRDAASAKDNLRINLHAVNVIPTVVTGAARPQLEEAAKPAQRPAETTTAPAGGSAKSLPRSGDAELPANEPAGSKLIVGRHIKLRGVEITDCDTLVVEGRVEASMDSRVVQIAESGVFTGTATMEVAEIWGRFDGQLTTRELVIYATGRVSGDILYGKIRIEEGGELTGDVSTLESAEAVPPPAERTDTKVNVLTTTVPTLVPCPTPAN